MTKEITEEWKRITECPRYEISSQGRVRSYTKNGSTEGKILKPTRDKDGYQMVFLKEGLTRTSNNKTLCRKIHRLVAEGFVPIPEELKHIPKEKLQVDHIIPISEGGGIINEETKEFNLRWCTAKGNTHNPITLKKVRNNAMEKRKTVYQYDEDLNLIATYPSTLEAARKLNKSQGNIASCCCGSLRRYLGCIWSYVPLTTKEERERLENEREEQRQRTYANTLKALASFYRRNRDKRLEYIKKYYKTHKQEKREYAKKYYETHKDIYNERARKWQQEHKEWRKEYQRKYYQEHKEMCKEMVRRWQQRKRQEKQQLKDEDGKKEIQN